MIGIAAFTATGPCWICGCCEGVRLHESRLDLAAFAEQDPELASYTGERVWLWRCTACGFSQPERLPSLPRYFERMYDQRWSPGWIAGEFEARYKDLIFSRVLSGLAERLPVSRRRLLDVGAHVGRFLLLAQRAGWAVEGVELNPRTAAYAAQRTGAAVHRVSADRIGAVSSRFDALTLIDVLEHIPRPVQLLREIGSLMTPGAWIAVKVPCGPAQHVKEKLRARVQPGYRATLADNLVHVNHFSPRALRLALTSAGFDAVSVEVAAPELLELAGWRGRMSRGFRLTVFHLGRMLPGGVHTPLALNLQAYARRQG